MFLAGLSLFLTIVPLVVFSAGIVILVADQRRHFGAPLVGIDLLLMGLLYSGPTAYQVGPGLTLLAALGIGRVLQVSSQAVRVFEPVIADLGHVLGK